MIGSTQERAGRGLSGPGAEGATQKTRGTSRCPPASPNPGPGVQPWKSAASLKHTSNWGAKAPRNLSQKQKRGLLTTEYRPCFHGPRFFTKSVTCGRCCQGGVSSREDGPPRPAPRRVPQSPRAFPASDLSAGPPGALASLLTQVRKVIQTQDAPARSSDLDLEPGARGAECEILRRTFHAGTATSGRSSRLLRSPAGSANGDWC